MGGHDAVHRSWPDKHRPALYQHKPAGHKHSSGTSCMCLHSADRCMTRARNRPAAALAAWVDVVGQKHADGLPTQQKRGLICTLHLLGKGLACQQERRKSSLMCWV